METGTAIVTGYSSGLGRALTEELLGRGWRVVGVSRKSRPEDLHNSHPDNLRNVHGSVDDDRTVTDAFSAASEFGAVKLVINCAGQGVFGDIGSYSAADIATAVSGNLAGLILFSDRAVQEMESSGGIIVNVMSTAAKKLRAAESVYCAVKWGAKGYTRTLREAIKSKKMPIRVIEVYPCGMSTPFWQCAVRPPSDGSSFPHAEGIASEVLTTVLGDGDAYVQELTFERA